MTLIELGRQVSITNRTTPLQRFVRHVTLGPFTTDAGLLSTFPGLDESLRANISITGLREQGGAIYDAKVSLSEVVQEQQTFYWDNVAQILYFHIPPSDSPFTTILLYGLAQGFTDSQVTYIDNVEYLPLVTSSPSIRQQQDIENYNRLSFITGTITIANNDGRIDDLIDQPIYGNDVLIYYASPEATTREELQQIASLFVEDYDISTGALSLRIQDRRKSQNISIPSTRFTTSADIDDELIGEIVPVIWGTPREVPAIVTNGKSTTGNVTYRAAILLTAIGTVQAETSPGTWETVTPSNVNLAEGAFELTAAFGRDTEGQPWPVKLVSPTGIAITRITDIIKDANERFLGTLYTESNYNITEWEAEELAISTGAYYLNTEKQLFEVIRDLQNGANVGFRYEIAPDGRRTIRVDDETRELKCFVDKIFLQNRSNLNIRTDSKTLLAEVVVKYGLSHVSGRWLRYVNSDSLDDVIEIYQQQPRREYETVLQTVALAEEKATYLRNRFDRIRGIGEFILMGEDFLNLRIYDIINIEISPDDERKFYGTWKAKVLSIAPDSKAVTNRITAVLIEEVI